MSIFTSRKFRVDILAIFITLFLISILGITYYFYTRSNQAVLKVANAFISRTLDSITHKMDDFLRPTPLFSIASLIMNDKRLDDADMSSLSSYMHVVLKAYPQLVNTYIADTSGDIFIENRISELPLSNQYIPFVDKKNIPPNAKFISVVLKPSNGKSDIQYVYKNALGVILKTGHEVAPLYDSTKRPWYLSAKESGGSMWIGVYPFFGMPVEAVTIAFPVYINAHFMGVAAADVYISSIKAAIDQFSVESEGIVFIANLKGQIIASKDEAIRDQDSGNLITVDKVSSPIIKKAYELYMKDGVGNFIFEVENITYITHFKTYSVSGDQKWVIAAVVPIDVFVGSLNLVNRNALIFSLVTLLFGLVLVVLSSEKISRPIIRMAEETQDMQHFNFTKETKIKSHIYEVQVMVTALNIAKAALNSFSKYVPRMIVDQLLRVGTIAELGGEKKKITVLFSDIKNFTQLSEQLPPNVLMLHLSEYLNALTNCIHRYNGNIDKYIGDSIMAFWGAPVDDPNQVHHACLALLDCQSEVGRLSRVAVARGKPVFATRFGMNVGEAIVGNLGSSDRLNYTAIGDTVNLASRLEEANKAYQSDIIVSEAVYLEARDRFLFRPVDIIRVKGKEKSMTVYELLSENEHGTEFPPTDEQLNIHRVFTEAYRLYHRDEYQASLVLLRELLVRHPDDILTKIYVKRCQEHLIK